MINKLKHLDANVIIITVSLISTAIIFIIAQQLNNLWQDFAINLSASMLAIGITVILVDLLREHRLKQQYEMPKDTAIRKILSAHGTLSIQLADKHRGKHKEILERLVSRIKEPSEGRDNFQKGSAEAFVAFESISASEILSPYKTKASLQLFKKQILNVRKRYEDTSNKYSFSFRDASIQSDYVRLLEAIDNLIAIIEIVEFEGKDIKEVLKQEVDLINLIGKVFADYIAEFNTFVKRHLPEVFND